MTAVDFTILLPVNRPPHMLAHAIRSVQAQYGASFEMFVICDGAPDATADCAQSFADNDPRIRVLRFEKGQRHGEAHRHTALADARGTYVAQIGDDDIWFPGHLVALRQLLRRVDFGNLLQADILADGTHHLHVGDLSDLRFRRAMLSANFSFFGPSSAGYRLSAYRKLQMGWSPAPLGVWTDLYMWRKFVSRDDFVFGTSFTVECVKPSASARRDMSLSERADEQERLAVRFADPSERDAYRAAVLNDLPARLKDARRLVSRRLIGARFPFLLTAARMLRTLFVR